MLGLSVGQHAAHPPHSRRTGIGALGPLRLALFLVVVVAGCTSARSAADLDLGTSPRIVRVAAHGMHTGLILQAEDIAASAWPARADFASAEFLEVGWGDREYYVSEDPGLWLGLRALASSTSSALHVVGFRGSIEQQFPAREIVAVSLSGIGFERLVAFVRDTHAYDANGRPIVLGPGGAANSLFYASDRRFHLFETCNTWVARALRAGGLPIDPTPAFTSSALMMQVRAAAPHGAPAAIDAR